MIEVREVSFGYEAGSPVLDGVSLHVEAGERAVLLGLNGSGKSTLGRLVNGALRPSSGTVEVDGSDEGLARRVGFVRQDPTAQIVSSLVSDEVAFGPRNLGLAADEVRGRVAGALEACGISELAGRMTGELSGGQQQLVALAGVLAMRPSHLVLDEAGSQLDGAARRRLRELVERLAGEGMGVLEITHGVEAVFGASRVYVLGAGRVAWEGSPQELFSRPDVLELAGLADCPLACLVAEGVARGFELGSEADPERLSRLLGRREGARPARTAAGGARLGLICEGVSVEYGALRALSGLSFEAPVGLTLLLGRSGSGKTTAARVLAGVLEPDCGGALLHGEPVRAGRVGLAFQRPADQLFANTVLEDVMYGPRMLGLAEGAAESAALEACCELGVGEGLLSRSPFELSGGQMRSAALAGVVAADPGAYVFDEPTAGLDAPSRRQFRELVARLVKKGAPVVVVTHDAGEWLAEADRVVFLRRGSVTACVSAGEALCDPGLFYGAGLEPPFEVRYAAACEEACHA